MQTAQGWAPALAAVDLSDLLLREDFDPRPVGLPELERAGWQLSRAQHPPSVVVLQRSDGASVRSVTAISPAVALCTGSIWAIDFSRAAAAVVFCADPLPGESQHTSAVILQQDAGGTVTASVLARRLAVSLLVAGVLPKALWPPEGIDPWLHEVVRNLLVAPDPLDVWNAAARCWRWADPPIDPGPYIAWARKHGAEYANRIEAIAAARARLAEARLDNLLEDADADADDWRFAVDALGLERDGLQGVRLLLRNVVGQGNLVELNAALEDLDRLGRAVPLTLSAWPASDAEAARRAWLAEPAEWWTAHESARASEGWGDE
jgi:hypothetical protein